MKKYFDTKRIIIISSYSEMIYAEYLYEKSNFPHQTMFVTADKGIYNNLIKKKLNCVFLFFKIPSVSNNTNFIALIKTLLIIVRLLIYKIKLFLFFKKFPKLEVIYYFGGHCSKDIPFFIESLRNYKIICFDYYGWMKDFKPFLNKLKKINYLFYKPSVFIFFYIYNFLSGSKYRMILTKDGTYLTIKIKKFKNEIILNLDNNLNNKIIKNYNKSLKRNNNLKKSVVILYQESDFLIKNFKVEKFIKDFNFLLEELKKKNYSVYFKVHPHWNKSFDNKPVLERYQNFKFNVLDSNEPVEEINFMPDFFIGYISSAFKFLSPKKNNLIFTYEDYCPYLYYSFNYKLGIKYLKNNKKNIFFSSIKDFTKNL